MMAPPMMCHSSLAHPPGLYPRLLRTRTNPRGPVVEQVGGRQRWQSRGGGGTGLRVKPTTPQQNPLHTNKTHCTPTKPTAHQSAGETHRQGGERQSDARPPRMRVPPPPSPPVRLALIQGWQRDAWRQLCLPPAALTSPTGYEGACLGQGVLLQVFAEEGRGGETPALPLTLCLQRGRLEPLLAKWPQ